MRKSLLNDNNIMFLGGYYRYVSHLYQLASTGWKAKSKLLSGRDIIRTDKSALIIMNKRYRAFFNCR